MTDANHAAARAYAIRNRHLARLGFVSYAAYLASPLWAKIRARALAAPDGSRKRCSCGALATQVHHARYTLANLAGRSLRWLVPTCDRCHAAAEYDRCGRKLSPSEATRRLAAVAALARKERLCAPFRQRLGAFRDPNAASHMQSLRRPL